MEGGKESRWEEKSSSNSSMNRNGSEEAERKGENGKEEGIGIEKHTFIFF